VARAEHASQRLRLAARSASATTRPPMVAALRLLTEAIARQVRWDWALADEPPWPVRTLVHLPPRAARPARPPGGTRTSGANGTGSGCVPIAGGLASSASGTCGPAARTAGWWWTARGPGGSRRWPPRRRMPPSPRSGSCSENSPTPGSRSGSATGTRSCRSGRGAGRFRSSTPDHVKSGSGGLRVIGSAALANLGDGIRQVALPLLVVSVTRGPGRGQPAHRRVVPALGAAGPADRRVRRPEQPRRGRGRGERRPGGPARGPDGGAPGRPPVPGRAVRRGLRARRGARLPTTTRPSRCSPRWSPMPPWKRPTARSRSSSRQASTWPARAGGGVDVHDVGGPPVRPDAVGLVIGAALIARIPARPEGPRGARPPARAFLSEVPAGLRWLSALRRRPLDHRHRRRPHLLHPDVGCRCWSCSRPARWACRRRGTASCSPSARSRAWPAPRPRRCSSAASSAGRSRCSRWPRPRRASSRWRRSPARWSPRSAWGDSGFTFALWNVLSVTLRQRLVPPELLGRGQQREPDPVHDGRPGRRAGRRSRRGRPGPARGLLAQRASGDRSRGGVRAGRARRYSMPRSSAASRGGDMSGGHQHDLTAVSSTFPTCCRWSR